MIRIASRRMNRTMAVGAASFCALTPAGTCATTSATIRDDVGQVDWQASLKRLLGSRKRPDADEFVVKYQKDATAFLNAYSRAELPSERKRMLKHLTNRYGDSYVQNITMSARGSGNWLSDMIKLLKDSPPIYTQLFRAIGHLEDGIKFLVTLRADILTFSGERAEPSFKLMDYILRDLLSIWFSVGLLYVERVTWKSPCDILERVAQFESVHPVRGWADLKSRVGAARRCFVFLHPSMPREPLVVLHVALMDRIPDKIADVISLERSNAEDSGRFNTAIFYSINSTQPGLKGIDLGHFMIKRVVQALNAELPMVNAFSTLSPVPGFRKWLLEEMDRRSKGVDNQQFPLGTSEISLLMDNVTSESDTSSWFEDEATREQLRPILLRACTYYLIRVKHRAYAYDKVANFHLRNGAVVWRVNWAADTSANGVQQSCSIMVNYRYYPESTETNSRLYVDEKQIQVHDDVKAHLRTEHHEANDENI